MDSNWVEGKCSGKGILYDEAGEVVHKGKFKDGETA